MNTTTTRLFALASTLVALAALLPLSSDAARPPGRNPHVDKSAARADIVEDFRALEAVRRFELDGVSLQTPWDAIPGILAGRGYCDLSSRDTRHFVMSFSTSPLECNRPPRPPAVGYAA